MNLIEYKGYQAKIEFDAESNTLLGTVIHLSDVVTFQATDAKTVKKEFEEAVEDYLETCKAIGKNPEKAFSGTFNIRLTPQLHRQLAIQALQRNTTLNDFVKECLEQALTSQRQGAKREMQVTINVYGPADQSESNNSIGEVTQYESIPVGAYTNFRTIGTLKGSATH